MPNEGKTLDEATDADRLVTEPRFWGTHAHTVDSKGRVILPARFRDPFRQGAFLAKAPGGCLGVWTPQEFERRIAAMLESGRRGENGRNVARSMAAGTFDVVPDSQGRIAIPAQLRAYARLEPDGDVMLNGAINHLEIWNADKWLEVDAAGSQHLLSGTDAIDELSF